MKNKVVYFKNIQTIYFQLIVILFYLCFIGGCKTQKVEPYSFFVAGHVYGSPFRKAPGLHPPFVEEFSFIRQVPHLKFGFFTGDIVYYSRDTFWNAIDQQVENLGVPVHFAVGNHDEGHRSPYQERYGKTFFGFEKNNDLFLVLNPGLNGWNIKGKQLEFLKKQLKKARYFKNVFIFFHQVLWWSPDNKFSSMPPNSLDGRSPQINFWSEIMPLLHSIEKPVYCFAGDVGANFKSASFFAHKENNVHFLASGMGSLKDDNYLLVKVGVDKKVDIEVRWMQKNTTQLIRWEVISPNP